MRARGDLGRVRDRAAGLERLGVLGGDGPGAVVLERLLESGGAAAEAGRLLELDGQRVLAVLRPLPGDLHEQLLARAAVGAHRLGDRGGGDRTIALLRLTDVRAARVVARLAAGGEEGDVEGQRRALLGQTACDGRGGDRRRGMHPLAVLHRDPVVLHGAVLAALGAAALEDVPVQAGLERRGLGEGGAAGDLGALRGVGDRGRLPLGQHRELRDRTGERGQDGRGEHEGAACREQSRGGAGREGVP